MMALPRFGIYALYILAFVLVACSPNVQPADVIIKNGVVYTVDSANAQAEAIVIRGDSIVMVGTNDDAGAYRGTLTKVIDAGGQFVMPGFMEGHGHIHGLGNFLRDINVMDVSGFEEIVEKVKAAVAKAKPGEWIIGRGWHQEKWQQAPEPSFLGYAYHDALSAAAPDNPVLLTHASGHALFVNQKAMDLAGITAATANPEGGEIVKDKSGKIVGVLEERAMGTVYAAYNAFLSQSTESDLRNNWYAGIELAEADCIKKGITSFVDAGSSVSQIRWMKALADSGKLKLRHWLMLRESNAALRRNASLFPILGAGGNHLTMNAIKVSLDGALGSYGAWLLEPYTDRPGFSGQNTFDMDSLRAIAAFAWDNDIQLCVHAIGDKANRETINIFSEQIQKKQSKDHRWRVEHAQHVNPAEIPRFHEWHIIASMQGIHCTSDAPYVLKRLGEERAASGAYMWRAFLDNGVLVNNGTDVPVENADPIPNFYASVTRKLKDGSNFYPQQSMTRAEAIYSYTMANAKAQFQEKELGSLAAGKLADIVILSNNLLTCSDADILNTKVIYTIIGGKVVYQKP